MLNLMVLLLVPVHDPPATEVVGAELHDHPVVGQDADVVHPHFPADVSENLVPVVQLHPEEGIRERLDNRALNLDGAVFLGHVLRASLLSYWPAPERGLVFASRASPYCRESRTGLAIPSWAAILPAWFTSMLACRQRDGKPGGPVSWSRKRSPERRPGRTRQMGRRRVYSTLRPDANRPGCKTLQAPPVFPGYVAASGASRLAGRERLPVTVPRASRLGEAAGAHLPG